MRAYAIASPIPSPATPLVVSEVIANLRSIDAVPHAELPRDGLACEALILLILAGHDTYAYASGGQATGTWCAWIDPLAERRSDHNGRVTLAEWCSSWRELVAEMGMHASAPDASDPGNPIH